MTIGSTATDDGFALVLPSCMSPALPWTLRVDEISEGGTTAWEVRVTADGIYEVEFGVAPSGAETLVEPTPVADLKMVTAILQDSEGDIFTSGTIEVAELPPDAIEAWCCRQSLGVIVRPV